MVFFEPIKFFELILRYASHFIKTMTNTFIEDISSGCLSLVFYFFGKSWKQVENV